MKDFPTYQELLNRKDAPPGSSWGLFGENDDLGMTNFITPEIVKNAAQLVKRGATFNLDRSLNAFEPPTSSHRTPLKHTMYGTHSNHRDDYIDNFYLQSTSQIDSLRHMRHAQYGFYNGAPDDSIVVGNPRNGISRWAENPIVGRGVLIDLEQHYKAIGQPIDQSTNFAIPVSEIDAAAKRQGVTMRPGDILMLRTGWQKYYFEELTTEQRRNFPKAIRSPGLLQSPDTLAWLWDHRIAVCAADNPGVEAVPPFSPVADEAMAKAIFSGHAPLLHPDLIALLGIVLGELWDLEALAKDCSADNVWECMVTIKPLNLIGGVGSPPNAIALK